MKRLFSFDAIDDFVQVCPDFLSGIRRFANCTNEGSSRQLPMIFLSIFRLKRYCKRLSPIGKPFERFITLIWFQVDLPTST